jgi:hypothetical protein
MRWKMSPQNLGIKLDDSTGNPKKNLRAGAEGQRNQLVGKKSQRSPGHAQLFN